MNLTAAASPEGILLEKGKLRVPTFVEKPSFWDFSKNDSFTEFTVTSHPFQITTTSMVFDCENISGLVQLEDWTTGNDVSNYTSEDLWRENEAYVQLVIPSLVYVALMMVIGVPGNSLAVYVYGVKFRTATQHFLIVCLGLCDLTIGLIAMPTEISDIRYHLTFSSSFVCRLLRFVTIFCTLTSNCILVVIAVDRYRRICHPLRYQMTLKEARIGAALSVGLALLVSWPLFVITGLRTTKTKLKGLCGRECSISDDFKDTKYPTVLMMTLGIGFVVMTAVLTVLYFLIWRRARAHRIGRRSPGPLTPTGKLKAYCVSSISSSQIHFGEPAKCKDDDSPALSPQSRPASGISTQASSLSDSSDLSIVCSKEVFMPGTIFSYDVEATGNRDIGSGSRTTEGGGRLSKLFKRKISFSMDKTTLVAFAVTLVFVLSFLPHVTLMLVRHLTDHFHSSLSDSVHLNLYNVFVRSYFLNSAANPVIYGVFNLRFRLECEAIFKKMLSRFPCCKRWSEKSEC